MRDVRVSGGSGANREMWAFDRAGVAPEIFPYLVPRSVVDGPHGLPSPYFHDLEAIAVANAGDEAT